MSTGSYEWLYVLNLGNTMLGVPMLAMPYCIEQCGCLLGTLLIFFAGYMSVESSIFLLRTALITSTDSYETTAEHIYGRFGKSFIAACIIAFIFGIVVASFVIIGDIIPTILKANFPSIDESILFREKVLMFVAIFIILPLSLIRDTGQLVPFSVFSLLTYAVFILYLFSEAFYFGPTNIFHPNVKLFNLNGVLKCIPIILTGFSCQAQMLIYLETFPDSMKGVRDVKPLVIRAMLIVCVVYTAVGIFGYFTFVKEPLGTDIFQNLSTSFLHQLLRLAFCTSVIISYPMVIFPMRSCLYSIIFSRGQLTQNIKIPNFYFLFITVVIVLGSMVIAMMVPNIGIILNFTGGYAGAILSLIFPALMFIQKSTHDDHLNGAKLLLIMGIVSLLSGPVILLTENYQYEDDRVLVLPDIQAPTFNPVNTELELPEKHEIDTDTSVRINSSEFIVKGEGRGLLRDVRANKSEEKTHSTTHGSNLKKFTNAVKIDLDLEIDKKIIKKNKTIKIVNG